MPWKIAATLIALSRFACLWLAFAAVETRLVVLSVRKRA